MIEWTVEFASHDNGLLINNNGVCIYEDSRIVITRGMARDKTLRILKHELTHAYEYAYGLKNMASDDKHEDLANFVMLYADQIITQANYIMGFVKHE